MDLPQVGPSSASKQAHYLDQRELNEAVQLLKVGAEKFLGCTIYLRAGGPEGVIVNKMGIKRASEVDNTGNLERLLEAIFPLVEAFGGTVVETDPDSNGIKGGEHAG